MRHETAELSRRGFCQAAAAALAGVGLGRLPARGDEPAVPSKVRIGLIDSLFRDYYVWQVMFALQPFKAYLEKQMGGITGELAEGGSALDMGEALKGKKLQLGVFHGLEFAWAKQRYPKLQPLFIAVNVERALQAQLIVRADSGLRKIEDLEKQILRIPSRGREHCWVFLERRCTKPGVHPAKYFRRIRKSGEAEEVLDAVAAKEAQVTVVDGIDWEVYKRAHPEKAGALRPMLTSERFPCALIAHHGDDLPKGMLESFRKRMLLAHKTVQGQKVLKLMRITGFEEVPKDFDDQLAAAAKAYPMKA